MTVLELLWSFVQVGLLSVGGGYAAIPLIQEQAVVRHGWLTLREFSDLVTIAEMTPGPIAVNAATFIGIRLAGVPGAVAATLGCVVPSGIFVLLLARLYDRYRKTTLLQSVLGCLRPAAAALIASAGLSILGTAVLPDGFSAGNPCWAGAAVFACAFFVLRRFRLSPVLVMLACGGIFVLFGLLTGAA